MKHQHSRHHSNLDYNQFKSIIIKQSDHKNHKNLFVGNLNEKFVEQKNNVDSNMLSPKLNKVLTFQSFIKQKFDLHNYRQKNKNKGSMMIQPFHNKHAQSRTNKTIDIDIPQKKKIYLQIDKKYKLQDMRSVSANAKKSKKINSSQLQQTSNTQTTINNGTQPSQLKQHGYVHYEKKIPTFLKTIIKQKNQTRDLYLKSNKSTSIIKKKSQTTRQDFEFGAKIGQGSYGKVFITRQIHTNFICAIKQISKNRIKQLKIIQNIIRQLKIQSFTQHQHCAQIYGFFEDTDYLYMILQYLPDGDLQKKFISRHKSNSEQLVAQILLQICQIVRELHKNDIIHRDIKPQNIFIFGKTVKIGDFGCSVYSEAMRNTVIGTLQYMSPQQFKQERYNRLIDNWSIGILTYELLYGTSPYKDEIIRILCHQNEQKQFHEVQFPTFPVVSDDCKGFIRKLLTKQFSKRMSLRQALKHKFLQKAISNKNRQQKEMNKLLNCLGL